MGMNLIEAEGARIGVGDGAQTVILQDPVPSAEYVLGLAQGIKGTSSVLAKQRIIQKEIVAYPQLELIFYFALSGDFATHVGDTTYFALRNSVGHEHTVHGEGAHTLSQAWATFELLHTRLVSGALSGAKKEQTLHNFLRSCTRAAATVFLKLFAQNLFANLTAVTVNNAVGYEIIPLWGVQLCNTYMPTKKYADTTYWWATPKINGFRATFKNGHLYSRTGKIWEGVGFDAICAECEHLQQLTGFNVFDGELCVPAGSKQPLSFQELSSVLRNSDRRVAEKRTIHFNIFAAVDIGNRLRRYGVADTFDMYTQLHRHLPLDEREHNYAYLRALQPTYIQNTAEAVIARCRQYVWAGYEGIVLRHPKEAYNTKRSNRLLKYKFFNEVDLPIVDVFQGAGKYQDIMGALLLAGEVEGRKVRVSCGTGFDEEQRTRMWQDRKALIGQIATVKYQNLTDEDIYGTCSLAFPVFMHLKEK